MEDGVVFLAEGTQRERDRAVAQFDVAHLAHDIVGVGDDEVGESAVVLFEPFGALCVGLAGHLRTKIGELLAELLDLGLGFEVLESAADGRVGESDSDGAKGTGLEFWVPLHDVERALRGERVIVVVYAGNDFAFFRVGVRGNGEVRAFDWSVDGFGSWCTWERDGGWIDVGFSLSVGEVCRSGGRVHKCDGGGTELCLGRDDFDAVAEDGGRHVVVVWKCWWRWDLRERMETLRFFCPLLSCSEGAKGFFR